MKQVTLRFRIKAFLTLFMTVIFQMVSWAQESTKVEINGNDVGSWFGRNWMWVAGAIVLLLLLLLLGGGTSRRSSKTTTFHKEDGGVVRTTTVSESESD